MNHSLLLISCFTFLLSNIADASLIIYVEEDNVNNEINFSWTGEIGPSGTGDPASNSWSADYIIPSFNQLFIGDRSRTDVTDGGSGSWISHRRYTGETFSYGGGTSAFTNFVATSNTSFAVVGSFLYVGSVTDGASDHPDLSTHTFTGSFTLPGSFATYGLFDTVGTDISSGPVTLWTADTGSGSIVFQQASSGPAVPEPSSLVLLSLSGLGGLFLMRRRRWKPENQLNQR